MSDELKPCPFCGGAAECHESERLDSSGLIYLVTCGNRCFGNAYSLDCEFHTKAGAIAAWNTRAPTAETARADENERLYWELRGILATQIARADALELDYQEECKLHNQDIQRNVELQARADAAGWQPIETYIALKIKPKHTVFWFAAMTDMRNYLPGFISVVRSFGKRIVTHWMPLPEPPEDKQ